MALRLSSICAAVEGPVTQTFVHIGMKENESVAVGWDQRGLVYRYELGLEELAPASGGEDHDLASLSYFRRTSIVIIPCPGVKIPSGSNLLRSVHFLIFGSKE